MSDDLGILIEEVPIEEVPALVDAPLVFVIQLSLSGALAAVKYAKERWPKTMVVGYLTVPEPDLWRRAEDAGCDVVTTRGALRKGIPERIRLWQQEPGGRRFRLFPLLDIAGRLGLVMRLEDSPVGPLAVYHIAGEILAIEDRCPHAGATLSLGDLDMDSGVVTCPEHGSRFDTHTGARVRGPSDFPIRTYSVEVEDETAYVKIGG